MTPPPLDAADVTALSSVAFARRAFLRRPGSGGTTLRRVRGSLAILAVSFAWLASGCMGTAGLVAGPISGPISAIRHDQSFGAILWAIPFGTYLGFMRGIQQDKDFFATGSYTTPGTMCCSEVFDPVGDLKSPDTYRATSAEE